MNVDTIEKEKFLKWCIKNLSFSRQEMYWLLHFLLRHRYILKNIHFVERAHMTQRGLILHAGVTSIPMYFNLNGQEFIDEEQIFHEIRFHHDQKLYVEIHFEQAWKNELYIGVLEDNPFFSWNQQLHPHLENEVQQALNQLHDETKKEMLLKEIDKSIENGEKERFYALVQTLEEKTSHQEKRQ